MGWDDDFGVAFLKGQIASGVTLPTHGQVFISLKDGDKVQILDGARTLIQEGFTITATSGTATFLSENGIAVERVNKVMEGQPHIVDAMINGQICLVMNTTEGAQSLMDSASIRSTAVTRKIPYFTTLSASLAAIQAILALKTQEMRVAPLQS